MKKIDTERLIRLYVFVSLPVMLILLGAAIYLSVVIRNVQVSMDYTEVNATAICERTDINACLIRPLPYQEHKYFWQFWK